MNSIDNHRHKFGNHMATQQLRCFYLPHRDSEHGLVDEKLHWGLYDVQSLSFCVRFVLVAASPEAWAIGPAAIGAGLVSLITDYKSELGMPTTTGVKAADSLHHRSIWILQSPHDRYHVVVYDKRQHRVTWYPVLSLDPSKPAGSVDALRLLFPINADEGILALANHFHSRK